MGAGAGQNFQDYYAVAVGYAAGNAGQHSYAVAIGPQAGNNNQGTGSVAIGIEAGYDNQGQSSVAIGPQAGYTGQGQGAVAIGPQAGYNGQGSNALAIGANAGVNLQASNSIVLNASGNPLDAGNSGFFVNPISIDTISAGATGVLAYNSITSEIIAYANKTFIIDHPVKTDKYLVHACLEGPEAGVYYRGINKIFNGTHVTIELPDYVEKLATELTVQITPIYDGKLKLYNVSLVENNRFTVYGENGSFNWIVHGKRGLNIEVEPSKTSVEIKGDGPYRWI